MAEYPRDQTLALAAMFQAAALTDQLAWRGHAEPTALEALLSGVLVFDTDDVSRIYGDPRGLQMGFKALEAAVTARRTTARQTEMTRYALSIAHIERQLAASLPLQQQLRRRLEQAAQQLKHFNAITATGMLNNLGHIYVDTLGTLDYRIQVKGDVRQLKVENMPEQIRAVLLGGVRAAWLWHRLGGRRWHFLIYRGRIIAQLRKIIAESRN